MFRKKSYLCGANGDTLIYVEWVKVEREVGGKAGAVPATVFASLRAATAFATSLKCAFGKTRCSGKSQETCHFARQNMRPRDKDCGMCN